MTLAADIEAAGGLVTVTDIARRYEVSKARAAQLVVAPSFPKPLKHRIGRSQVWIAHEVDVWRATPRRAGRPPTQ